MSSKLQAATALHPYISDTYSFVHIGVESLTELSQLTLLDANGI